MMPAIARTRNGFDHATCKSLSAPPANSGSLEPRDRFPDVEVIVGALALTPPALTPCIELHRTTSCCTPPPARAANAQVSLMAVRGCGPRCRGFESLIHPKIDRLLTCTGALYKIYSRHRDVAPASGRGWDEFVFTSLGGKAW
jgi:hypothetical protein